MHFAPASLRATLPHGARNRRKKRSVARAHIKHGGAQHAHINTHVRFSASRIAAG